MFRVADSIYLVSFAVWFCSSYIVNRLFETWWINCESHMCSCGPWFGPRFDLVLDLVLPPVDITQTLWQIVVFLSLHCLARLFLLPLWQLLLVFAGFWWLLPAPAGFCLLLLACAYCCWFLPAAGSSFLAVTLVRLEVVRKGACVLLDLDRTSIEPRSDPAWLCRNPACRYTLRMDMT